MVFCKLNIAKWIKYDNYMFTFFQEIKMRGDLVDNRHSGYCKAMDEFVKRFGVNYIGGCCGCGPEGIKRFQEIYF